MSNIQTSKFKYHKIDIGDRIKTIMNGSSDSKINASGDTNFDQYLQDLSNNVTARTFEFNSSEAEKSRNWQEYMSNTSHQREVEDLKRSGLNPVLSANGGASAYSASSASGSADNSAIGVLSQLYMNRMNNQNAIKLAKLNNSNNLEMAKISASANLAGALASAGAMRYSSDNARIASIYGSDQAYLASVYGSDKNFQARKYNTDNSRSGSLLGTIWKATKDAVGDYAAPGGYHPKAPARHR